MVGIGTTISDIRSNRPAGWHVRNDPIYDGLDLARHLLDAGVEGVGERLAGAAVVGIIEKEGAGARPAVGAELILQAGRQGARLRLGRLARTGPAVHRFPDVAIAREQPYQAISLPCTGPTEPPPCNRRAGSIWTPTQETRDLGASNTLRKRLLVFAFLLRYGFSQGCRNDQICSKGTHTTNEIMKAGKQLCDRSIASRPQD